MSRGNNGAIDRLTQVADAVTGQKTASSNEIPFDPTSTAFPSRKELKPIEGAPAGAYVTLLILWVVYLRMRTDDVVGRGFGGRMIM